MNQHSDLQSQIVRLLLPYVDTPDDRKGLLNTSWGLGNPMIGDIDLTGAPRDFVLRLIQESAEYGRRDGKYPIELVLESIWHLSGSDKQREIDLILEQLRSGLGSFDPVQDRLPFEPELVQTAEGEHLLFMSRRAILAEEYAAFLNGSDPNEQAAPGFDAGWSGREPRPMAQGKPVVGINYAAAEAYARWLAEATSRPYRLPTLAEWKQGFESGKIDVVADLSEWTATTDQAGEASLRLGRPAARRMLGKIQDATAESEGSVSSISFLARLANPSFTFRVVLDLR
ncbi:MAG: SUMF1/EgtB/PvdO family nonheme iron enzyme [Anaerolineaceae bacterium]|nr:MAG: SUMF1/EgtB/PvdO family nonheme iron enzyme [Anaerolineaceae bacterium]